MEVPMNRSFENKVALVTGAGQGMGLAAARAFAEAGAAVALADRDEVLVQKAAQTLTKEGHKAIAIRCDVTNEQQVREMVNRFLTSDGWMLRLITRVCKALLLRQQTPVAKSLIG
jgi:NAD(P)-dependent dehydrogenase (short-subunit alcohol dehydrogenase family)